MRKLTIIEHISLDGVIQAPGGRNEDGDYAHGGWSTSFSDAAIMEAIVAIHSKSFDLLLGRRTYDIFSGYWPKAESSPLADGLNAAKKYVATHRPDSLAWGPVEDLGTDIIEGIRSMEVPRTALTHPLGKFHADARAARARFGRRSFADRLPGLPRPWQTLVLGERRPSRTRSRQHDGRVLRRAHEHLPARGPAANRGVRPAHKPHT